ncbi:MAG: diaminopimelate decarboxylase [Clostridium sp.]|nr:diaminopimelate decarboxylase [Clostridium sp.]
MFIPEALKINEKNHLEIGGCDCVDLVNEYGTPIYVLDEESIRQNCRSYKKAIDDYYGGNGLVLYASKALCTMAVCKIIQQEGLGLDVVSGGELYTAIKSGFPMKKVYFHGNNKTEDELVLAIDNDIGRIVVDNYSELKQINEIALRKGKIVDISFRIRPGVEAHTHDAIQTGQIDSKFGVAIEDGEALDIINKAAKMANVSVSGLHCHIGSQIFDVKPFKAAATIMIRFIAKIKETIGLEINELNLGGGYGVKYTNEDNSIKYENFIESVSKVIATECNKEGITPPYMVLEPGRSIIASAGITLYRVGNIKDIKGIRKYIAIDGGMTDNPRYALYQSKYDMVIANRANAPRVEKVTIAGKCCESGDLLAKDIMMPKIKEQDILAVFSTGAYNYSMSSNYNRIPRPPIILVKNKKARLIVKREDYEDIVRNDLMPEDL